jgi:hypothetical protein
MEMSLNNIKLMTELMDKARQIRNEQVSGNKLSKEEMLKKANEKITKYFREVLDIMPIKVINVDVDGEFNLHLRKAEKENTGLGKRLSSFEKSNVSHNGLAIMKTSGYGSNSYAIFSEHEKLNWHSTHLYPMESKTILLLVNSFDRMKELVEGEITRQIGEVIEKDSEVVQRDAMQMESLENFLN